MNNDLQMTSFPVAKKRVLLRGPVLTQSGYGVHSRQVARWAFSKPDWDVYVQALPWGDTPWIINTDSEDGLIGRMMERTVDPKGMSFDLSLQIQLPNEWDSTLAKTNIGVTAAVETDVCNPDWIHFCNKMSALIVPSSHAKACLENSGKITTRISVIPESFDDSILKASRTKIDDLDFSTSFNFLVFGQLTGNNPENDRKNIFYTIKWFCETFKDDKDVGLIIKTNVGRNTKIDRKIVTQLLENLLKEVRQDREFPKVHLIHGELSSEEVSSLYRHPKIKALLALTRGEGYGLPILEAAAAGLPVIATAWSGHTDFLRHGKYIEVGYKLERVHPTRVDDKIFIKNAKWANPQEDDFKKRATKFRSSPAIPQEWAKSLSEIIASKYSFAEVTKLYDEFYSEVTS